MLVPCDFILTLYKLFIKHKKYFLWKTYSQRGFRFLERISFTEKNVKQVCESFLSRESEKDLEYISSVRVSFAFFLERRRPNKYCLLEVGLAFHMWVFRMMCQVYFEKEQFIFCLHFRIFLWWRQKLFSVIILEFLQNI